MQKLSKQNKIIIFRLSLATLLFGLSFCFNLSFFLKLAYFIAIYLVLAYDVLWTAAINIIHGKIFDERFLMTIATIGAFAIADFPEAVAVMFFYQLGELFQSIAVGKSRRSISELVKICPEYAVVIRNNEEIRVSPEDVECGEIIIIKAGEKIPLDGEIIYGETSVNNSALTGESLPVKLSVGDKVLSGSININNVIKVKTSSKYEDSTVAKILELVENASSKKAKSENFISKFAKYYTPCIVISAVLLALLPPIFNGQWKVWINRALIFLVVSCPCALVISVPLSFFGGIGGASRHGILVKGANYLESLSKVKTVVFDKTGTLTKGVFKVVAIHPTKMNEAELLDIAALGESYSNHPIADSIVTAHGGHVDKSQVVNVEEISGKGIKLELKNKTIFIGNEKLMNDIAITVKQCHINGSIVHIADTNEYYGHIIISDELKPDSTAAIAKLKHLGIKQTVMLTGDNKIIGNDIADKLNIDSVFCDLLPADKVKILESLLNKDATLAYVGDGINDAPVLTRADIGIAMGSLGSDAAIEAADIVLMDDNPLKIAKSIEIAKKTMRLVYENITFALGVKAVVLVLSALGITNMWIAVFADVGVMILAILNAMRSLKKDRA